MEILYLIIAILIFQIFIITLLNFKPRESCCDGKACCKEKVEGLANPIPQEEFCCKDDMSDCSCSVPEINEFPSSETTISALGSPENRTKTFRGSPYQDLKDRQPLEENDPRPNQKKSLFIFITK